MNGPKRRPLPSKLDHLKMQAAMPGTLNGESARVELQQMDGPTAPVSESASVSPTYPPSVPVVAPPTPVEQASPVVDELPTAPAPATLVKQPVEAVSPIPAEHDSQEEEEAEVSSVPSPTTRQRRASTNAPSKTTASSSKDGNGGAVRISDDHANDLLAARLHFQTVHKTKINNQGFVADALDHYLAYLRKKGTLPPKREPIG
jgi:hypothetical protein